MTAPKTLPTSVSTIVSVQGWDSVGVKAGKDKNGGSLYSFNGQSITQGEAWKIAREAADRPRPIGMV